MEVLKLLALAQEKIAVIPGGLDVQIKILQVCQDLNDLIETNKKEFERKQWLEEHKFECPYCHARYATKEEANKHKDAADKWRRESHQSLIGKVHPMPKLKTLPIIEHTSPVR